MTRIPSIIAGFSLALGLCYAAPAFAAPEEVQVYMDEIAGRGEVGLDVHSNYVSSGTTDPSYAGAQNSLHRLRLTPEFSLGLGHGFEAGLYLPLATISSDGGVQAQGVKARLKWLAPHGTQGFYWGANVELGRVGQRLDINPWNGELKLIGGWRKGRWQIGANGNFDFVVSGPQPAPIGGELATKLAYQVADRVRLGVESYNGFGALRSPGRLSQEEHMTYLTLDTQLGRWDLNAGVGRGYGANRDQTIFKLILGVPLGRGR